MFIRTEELTHVYMPGTPFAATALRGVTLAIERGSCSALIGPSGSGKSTLIQHLNGLLKATAGRVVVDGRAVGEDRQEMLKLRRRVGLVFQMPEQQFFAETVYDEIAFAPRNMGCNPGAVEARVKQALNQVGLDYGKLKDRSPFHLSAGQKRLTAVAAILALRPEVLIMDEPTAGLDPANRQRLHDLLKTLNREAGLTILIVTHDLDQAAALADRILVLNDGRLVMSGPPAEILTRGAELRRLGLALPLLSEIMHGLSERGLPVNTAVFSLDQARREINRVRKQGATL
ncbi:MAG: energy-coupling factor transporter ATPase [Bacillota bacterium]